MESEEHCAECKNSRNGRETKKNNGRKKGWWEDQKWGRKVALEGYDWLKIYNGEIKLKTHSEGGKSERTSIDVIKWRAGGQEQLFKGLINHP